MKCLFCDYQYSAPNPNVTEDMVIINIISHMEFSHERQLEYLKEDLLINEVKKRNLK